MIRFVKGHFHLGADGSIIVETSSGIGIEIFVPSNSSVYRKLEGEEIKIHTSMIVKEDSMSLYGFEDLESLKMFELLLKVNGVGPKAGLAIMSTVPLGQLINAIAQGDSKTISMANGIGKKTAERIIIDLKDKVNSVENNIDYVNISEDDFADKSEANQAIDALVALGYSRNEATKGVAAIKRENLTTEEYIKLALRNLF